MSEIEFIRTVLAVFFQADIRDELLWRVDGDKVTFAANVSDIFEWGTADAEEITPDTLPELLKAYDDLNAIDGGFWTAALYAARKRHLRPQGAAYPVEHEFAVLFDECGPKRETGYGNPRSQPRPVETISLDQLGMEG